MKHDEMKQLLQLYLFGDLEADRMQEIKAHIAGCNECRRELDELIQFRNLIQNSGLEEVSDSLLSEAREELQNRLRLGQPRRSFWSGVKDTLARFLQPVKMPVPRYGLAFGAVSLLVIGVVVGILISNITGDRYPYEMLHAGIDDAQIMNFRILDHDATTGDIEFAYDNILPVERKGNIGDRDIQRILAHALVAEQNPGMRLQSVSAIGASQTHELDPEIKIALILTLQYDDNPGVRSEALSVLSKLPPDEDYKQALLHVLMYDDNTSLRIAAINRLEELLAVHHDLKQDVQKVLENKIQSDENEYIRMRTVAVLEEIQ